MCTCMYIYNLNVAPLLYYPMLLTVLSIIIMGLKSSLVWITISQSRSPCNTTVWLEVCCLCTCVLSDLPDVQVLNLKCVGEGGTKDEKNRVHVGMMITVNEIITVERRIELA